MTVAFSFHVLVMTHFSLSSIEMMMTMTMIIIVIIFIIMFMQIMTAVGCHLFDLIAYVFLKGF